MNTNLLSGAFAWIVLLTPSLGCGPFFADTVLDQPQASLDVPMVSYLAELYQIAGISPAIRDENRPPSPFLAQIPWESAELREFWQQAGIDSGEIENRIRHYESVRQILLAPIADSSEKDFPTHGATPPQLPVRPLGAEFPSDVADYVEAARLQAIGATDEARTLWKSILDRPLADRRLRAAWASWMLAKTSAELPECVEWYRRVETEMAAGATDVIGLRGAAKAWRAATTTDLLEAMHFYYDAFAGGKERSAIDLRRVSSKILGEPEPELLAKAAVDPLVRRLLNLQLQVFFDGPRQWPIEPSSVEVETSYKPWLDALEEQAPRPFDDGARIAWALYSQGRFEESRRWLALSDQSGPLALWLQAKFDLRDGKTEAARAHLTEALALRSRNPDSAPANPTLDVRWFEGANEIQSANHGRLLADIGIVAVSQKDYLAALESFRKAGYDEDANYLAEALISTDGLIRHVRKVAPAWTSVPIEPGFDRTTIDPFTCLTSPAVNLSMIGAENRLRYLLAKRLNREGRFKEAREFIPPSLLPLLDHYLALDRARQAGTYKGAAHAAVVWRQAMIHRHLGAELFSTEGAPDAAARGWLFSGQDYSSRAKFPLGWSHQWSHVPPLIASDNPLDRPVPPITADELSRLTRVSLSNHHRFHYRYDAANLAWEAAKSLPDNHPLLARLYNTAGQWISQQDPESADRFYQAIVRRCAKTPEGIEADQKRWFLTDLPPLEDLPQLPATFKPPVNTRN